MKLVDISKTFSKNAKPGTKPTQVVLNDLNLQLAYGEFLSITGPSGAGKSTLLNIMGLLDRPDSGAIISDGQDLTRLSNKARDKWRCHNLGFIFQFHHLLPELTMLENVALVLRMKGQSIKKANTEAVNTLSSLGLGDAVDKMPFELSGGQQQRAAVARAIVLKPKLILADEPTGNLDSQNAKMVFDLLKDCANKNNISVVMVTHNTALAQLCDRQVKL